EAFLGVRPGRWFYGFMGHPEKGPRKWLKEKLGEPPVLFSEVKPEEISVLIDAHLYNNGMFKAATTFTIDEKKKKAHVNYTTAAHPPFIIDTVIFPNGTDTLSRVIAAEHKNSLVEA